MTAHLPERQQQVLTLIADGLEVAEIALQLYISPSTVKTHLGSLFARFDARNRAQLIHRAHLHGHLALDPSDAEDLAVARQARELGCRIALIPQETP